MKEAEGRPKGGPSSHPLLPGACVSVLRLALAHRPYLEGSATIIAPVIGLDHVYTVRFKSENRIRQRLVMPGSPQAEPDAHLRQMMMAWRLTLMPELLTELLSNHR